LAVLPLAGSAGPIVPPLAALFLVAVPAADTSLAIARRFLSRCLRAWGEGLFWEGLSDGLKNTARPDRRHVHHRLPDLGFSRRRGRAHGERAARRLLAARRLPDGVAHHGRHGLRHAAPRVRRRHDRRLPDAPAARAPSRRRRRGRPLPPLPAGRDADAPLLRSPA